MNKELKAQVWTKTTIDALKTLCQSICGWNSPLPQPAPLQAALMAQTRRVLPAHAPSAMPLTCISTFLTSQCQNCGCSNGSFEFNFNDQLNQFASDCLFTRVQWKVRSRQVTSVSTSAPGPSTFASALLSCAYDPLKHVRREIHPNVASTCFFNLWSGYGP